MKTSFATVGLFVFLLLAGSAFAADPGSMAIPSGGSAIGHPADVLGSITPAAGVNHPIVLADRDDYGEHHEGYRGEGHHEDYGRRSCELSRVWVRGHYNRYGVWVAGHHRHGRWVVGYWRHGHWVSGRCA